MNPLAIASWLWKGAGFVLDFLGIPRWAPLAGLAGLIMLAGAYWKGHHDAAQDCHEATLRTKIASLERDVAAEKDARSIEAVQVIGLEAQRQQLSQKVADYEAALRTRPEPSCALSPDDVRTLGGLHGKRKH